MERLRQRADFLAAAAGVRAPATGFVLQVRGRGDDGPPRFGFTASRKVGTAVERNRARRRLRDVVRRTDAADVATGHDYVLVARRAALSLPFDRLVAEFRSALRRVADKRRTGETGARAHRVRGAGKTDGTASARPPRGARRGE